MTNLAQCLWGYHRVISAWGKSVQPFTHGMHATKALQRATYVSHTQHWPVARSRAEIEWKQTPAEGLQRNRDDRYRKNERRSLWASSWKYTLPVEDQITHRAQSFIGWEVYFTCLMKPFRGYSSIKCRFRSCPWAKEGFGIIEIYCWRNLGLDECKSCKVNPRNLEQRSWITWSDSWISQVCTMLSLHG